MTASVSTRVYESHWIGGNWRPAESGALIDVENPSTESTIASVAAGNSADADAAVRAAAAAQPRWAAEPLSARLRFLERLVGGLQARAEDLAATITAEVGAPVPVARGAQVGLAIMMAQSYLDIAARYEFERRVGNSLVVQEPTGVAACITPWNVPLLLSLQKIVPALMAGCTVVHKPSELTPCNTRLLAEIIAECDLVPGAYNVVFGEGPVVGAALARHPGVDLVTLTGSTRAGREVAALAAPTVKRLHLELGGKNASVVLPDADLSTAVRATVDQVCFNTGQTCLQWSRLLVPREREAEALQIAAEALQTYRVGDPLDPETDLGPLASAAASERVDNHIRTAIDEGAELICGGPGRPAGLERGHYARPTLFGSVRSDQAIARQEVFGPVLCVLPYSDEDEAAQIANDTEYGLHGAVWSSDTEYASRFARRIRTGVIDINGGDFNPIAPFGGVKQSGVGRECGVEGLAGFLETKSMQLPTDAAGPAGPRLRG